MPIDARGNEFSTGGYRRIVSLVPSWTESLFVLGVGDRVVAVTDYCVEPAAEVAKLRKIGGTKNPRVQEILSLHPDLVIANVEENSKADISRLDASGVPVFVTDARRFVDAIKELRAIGELASAKNLDAIVTPIERECSFSMAWGGRIARPRVFVAVWKNPWMTANAGTFVNDMLELGGGDNVFHDRIRHFPLSADLGLERAREVAGEHDTRYPRVSVDEIVERKPDIIMLPNEPYPFSEKDVDEWREHPGVPAVKNGQVILLDGKILSWYGTRMGESLKQLRMLLSDDNAA